MALTAKYSSLLVEVVYLPLFMVRQGKFVDVAPSRHKAFQSGLQGHENRF